MRLFAPDVVLLHPPAVYDFRRSRSLFGPVSDAVFSSPVFEMYPVGLTSLAARLEREGYNVRLVNLAHRMLEDPGYDVEAAIAAVRPLVFGIDLHWLLHAHGALEVARIVRRLHPDVPVLVGGLSASYYDRELARRPEVDFVLRGDSTEEAIVALVEALAFDRPLGRVPGLTWTDDAGEIRRTPLGAPPTTLDGIALPDYRWVVRSVVRSGFRPGRLADVMPYAGWTRYPMTGILTSRGCGRACVFCGGGRGAYRKTCGRERPAFRSADDLVDDLATVASFSRAPVMLLNDLRLDGAGRAQRFFDRMAARPAPNEVVYEAFFPAGEAFFRGAAAASRRFSVQLSIESHREETRRRVGKFACSDARIEATVRAALRAGAGRVDVFFMIGLPGQSYGEAVEAADWSRALVERLAADGALGRDDAGRLRFFAAPLSPFLDPGSPAFENPAAHGYRLRWRSLEEHRRAMAEPTWKEILDYETDAMTRDEIVAATYACYDRLAELDRDRGLLSDARTREALDNTRAAREVVRRVDEARELQDGPGRDAALEAIRRDIGGLEQQVAHTKAELRWPTARNLAPAHGLAGLVAKEAAREARRLIARRIPLWLRWLRSERGDCEQRDAGDESGLSRQMHVPLRFFRRGGGSRVNGSELPDVRPSRGPP